MQQHFVQFFSPGTFVDEVTSKPVDSWDVDQAIQLARKVTERHNSRPYGFQFVTRSREPEDLDSKETERSGMHYLGGHIETLEEIEARNDPDERILLSNMRSNGWHQVIVNDNSWRTTRPWLATDQLLDVNLRDSE